jgi:hypothetical protein
VEEERRRLCVWRAPKLLFTPISIPRNEDDDDKARRDCATTLLCLNACDDCCSVEKEALLLLLMSHAASAATATPLVAVAQGAAPRLAGTTAVAALDTTATSIAAPPRLLVLLLLLNRQETSPQRDTPRLPNTTNLSTNSSNPEDRSRLCTKKLQRENDRSEREERETVRFPLDLRKKWVQNFLGEQQQASSIPAETNGSPRIYRNNPPNKGKFDRGTQ